MAGDPAAKADFLRLLASHYLQIRRAIIMYVPHENDADDVMQETCLALWDHFSEYDRTRNFAAWAVTFARNKARNHLRSQYRRKSFGLPQQALSNLAKVQEAYSELFELRREKLEDCMSELHVDDRQLLWDCYGDGVKAVQWARKHDTSASTIHNKLRRLRDKLFDCVNRKLGLRKRRRS
ncbi:sigma-70 family RNA polymerase sigma factor [Calycomorphotria hydatis]|uniref:RNA polymerase sigma factor RpoE n=1 Tax=Calycomorphotria hydatis TaxID=2528027 RepID=A0A517TDC6_9PLAN|nr:sigma-70 family RNA polymerase sigma factor [Calycomorphotria hydatis]QDT66380.1 RNA polymerase sigma factor RpoE [Calycomorphotria hydatis]